jgi:hypothetical protein
MNLSVRLLSRLARAALADRVSLDDHQPLVESREHGEALLDELLSPERFAGPVEQDGIAFDLRQREAALVRLDKQLQQLGDDVGGVVDLRGAREIGESADVRNEDDRLFGHGEVSLG